MEVRLSDIAEAAYCLRRAALIINDNVWADNAYTVEGSAQHTRTHSRLVERTTDGIVYHEFAVNPRNTAFTASAMRFASRIIRKVLPFRSSTTLSSSYRLSTNMAGFAMRRPILFSYVGKPYVLRRCIKRQSLTGCYTSPAPTGIRRLFLPMPCVKLP